MVGSSEDKPSPQVGQARSRWPTVLLAVFIVLFLLTIWQRNRIRAHWWAARLEKAETLSNRTYYLSCLLSVGDSAKGAIRRLARSENPEARALAIPAMARLPEPVRLAELDRLLADPDAEIRQSAALALAFTGGEAVTDILARRATGRDSSAAAATAAAALSRIASPVALAILCKTAREHPDAAVRAQAVESVGAWLMAETGKAPSAASQPAGDVEPFAVLVSLLADRGEFDGPLSLEREIARAQRAVESPGGLPHPKAATFTTPHEPSSPPAPTAARRTVADIAAHWLTLLSLEAVDPAPERSASEQAELADRCCKAWLARQAVPIPDEIVPARQPPSSAPARQEPLPPADKTGSNPSSDTNPRQARSWRAAARASHQPEAQARVYSPSSFALACASGWLRAPRG